MNYEKRRLIVIIIAAVFVVATPVLLYIIQLMNSAGKVRIAITTSPTDAKVYIDGKETSHDPYVTPGKHAVSAKKDGFKDAETYQYFSKDSDSTTLVLSPNSEKARKWAKNHSSEIQRAYDIAANQRGKAMREQYKIMNILPHTDISGPYKISYSYYGRDYTDIKVYISYSTPSGRKAALAWLKSKGYDPTTLNIAIRSYVNPLTGKVYDN